MTVRAISVLETDKNTLLYAMGCKANQYHLRKKPKDKVFT